MREFARQNELYNIINVFIHTNKMKTNKRLESATNPRINKMQFSQKHAGIY